MADQAGEADDIATVMAAGVLAYLGADVAHHALGHGGACLALGGRILLLSSIQTRCTVTGAAVDVAGPLANLLLGLASWVAAVAVRSERPALKLLLLMSAGFNLFWLEGQLIFSAAARTDDWDQLIRGLSPSQAWRAGLIAIGAGGYGLTVRGLGAVGGAFGERLRRLMVPAYLAAGLTACLTGLRDPGGLPAILHHAAPQALVLPLGLFFLKPSPSAP